MLRGLMKLDPKRREPKGKNLGLVGVCLETLMVPPGNYVILTEIEFWTGPGYTGTKLTGTPYATKDSGGGVAANVFDGNFAGSSFWSADLSTGLAKIGLTSIPNPIQYAGTPPVFVAMSAAKSLRITAYDTANYWCSAYRLYYLNASLIDDKVAFAWKVAAEFSGIAFPGGYQNWGTDL